MKDPLLISLMVLYGLTALYRLFYILFLWQLKEYRIDRMIVHLKTPTGRKIIVGFITIVTWITLAIYTVFPQARVALYPLIVLYILELLSFARRGIGGIKFPKLTLKIIVLILMVIVSQGVILWQIRPLSFAILIADRTLPLVAVLLLLAIKPHLFSLKILFYYSSG